MVSEPGPDSRVNELLARFYAEQNAAAADVILNELCAPHGLRVIKRVALGILGADGQSANDVDDVISDATLQLWQALVRTKTDPDPAARIRDFKPYAGTIARNACLHYWGRAHRNAKVFKKVLRYTLKHDEEEFAYWRAKAGDVGGWKQWKGNEPGSITPLLNAPEESRPAKLPPGKFLGKIDYRSLLRTAFELSRCPLLFRPLARVLSDWVGLRETEMQSRDARDSDGEEGSGKAERPENEYREARRDLELLWREIMALPLGQRRALLLNAGKGAHAGDFINTGLASSEDVAKALVSRPI